MAWTLRHLLDYLDDRLDPEQTRRLGQVIAEHEEAHRIVERLKQITRKRRIAAPDFDPAKAEDHAGEPNIVAAYLDDVLTREESAELEKLCHESDIHLAEVAACHQIVSVGEGEQVLIPPIARQRMYGLVQGPEADPNRPVKVTDRPRLVYDVDGEVNEGEGDLLLEPVWQRMRRQARVLLPVAALLMALVIGALVYSLVGTVQEESIIAGPGKPKELDAKHPAPEVIAQLPAQEPKVLRPVQGELQPPQAFLAVWPSVASGLEKADQRAVWLVCTWTSSLASRPALPPNFLLGLGSEELVVHAERAAPAMPEAEKPAVSIPPVKPAPKVVGRLAADPQREGMLLRSLEELDWRIVRSMAPITSEEKLLVLPGFRNELELSDRVKLVLVGSMPVSQGTTLYAESAITLHATKDTDLEFTLDRGRILVTGKPDVSTKVRLRHQSQIWDLQLQPGTTVAMEATSRLRPGTGPWTTHHKLSLAVLNGTLEASRLGQKAQLKRGTLLVWDSTQTAPGTGTVLPQADIPAWPTAKAPAGEVKRTLTAFHDNIFRKVQNQQRELPWIVIACQEALGQNRESYRHMALYTLGAIDQIRELVSVPENAPTADTRRAALEALAHWAGRQPGQQQALRGVLRDRGYLDDEAELILALLRKIDKPDRAAVERLLANLKHKRLIIRELAYQNLLILLPQERLSGYNPSASPEQLDTSVDQLKRRLLR